MTAGEIAELLALAPSTVSLWLERLRLGKRSRPEPPEPPNRYERAQPGELVHGDIKQLGRISARGAGHRVVGHRGSQISTRRDGKYYRPTGFGYVHVMVDDHSRLAYAEVLDAHNAQVAIGFLHRALAWVAGRGVRVERVMTANGSATSPPALPPQNQRQSGALHPDAAQRVGQRPPLRQHTRTHRSTASHGSSYNYRLPHGSLGHQPPASRINT